MSSILKQVLKNYNDNENLHSDYVSQVINRLNNIIEEINTLVSKEEISDYFAEPYGYNDEISELDTLLSSYYHIINTINRSFSLIKNLSYENNKSLNLNTIRTSNRSEDNSILSFTYANDINYSIIDFISSHIFESNQYIYTYVQFVLTSSTSNINTVSFNEFLLSNGINPLNDEIMDLIYDIIGPVLRSIPHTIKEKIRVGNFSQIINNMFGKLDRRPNGYEQIVFLSNDIKFVLDYDIYTDESELKFIYRNTFKMTDIIDFLSSVEIPYDLDEKIIILQESNSKLLDDIIGFENIVTLRKETIIPILLKNITLNDISYEEFISSVIPKLRRICYRHKLKISNPVSFIFEGNLDTLLAERVRITYKGDRDLTLHFGYYYPASETLIINVDTDQ